MNLKYVGIFFIILFFSLNSVHAMDDLNQTTNELSYVDDDSICLNENIGDEVLSTDLDGGSFRQLMDMIWTTNEINLKGDLNRVQGDTDVILQGGKSATIYGNGHTMDGHNLGRAFVISPGSQLTVYNVRFINCNGYSPSYSSSHDGGAILNMGKLTLVDCTFENNHARDGGALACDVQAQTSISGTTVFKSNYADYDGGAIKNYGNSPMTITGKITFDSNTASVIDNNGKGGAILNQHSVFTLSCEKIFTNNVAVWDGGAIFNNEGTLKISGTSTFTNNKAIGNTKTGRLGFGGAINNEDGTMEIDGKNQFISNSAYRGGAIDSSLGAKTTISGENTFKNNHAGFQGGAIHNQGGARFELKGKNTFEANSADAGGAIGSYDTPVIISGDNMFSANTAIYSGGAIHLGFVKQISIGGHCYFYDNKATGSGGSGGAIYATDGATLNVKCAEFIRNVGVYGGAIHVNNNPINAIHNIFYANSAVTGGDIEVYRSNVETLDWNYWGSQSKPSQDRIHNYAVSNIRNWIILQSTIPSQITQGENFNIIRFVTNAGAGLSDNMADFGVSATPDFDSITIRNNIGSTKYNGNAVGSLTVSLSGPNFSDSKTVNVVQPKTQTSLSGNNLLFTDPNQSANYVVTLTDANGNKLSGKTVSITVDSRRNDRVTDNQGRATLVINNLANGYHEISTNFAGEGNYLASSTKNGVICIYSDQSGTNLIGRDLEMYYKDGSRYEVTLTDANGRAMGSKDVKFYISGSIYSRTTDSNGKASIAINLNSGTYEILACYPGTGNNDFSYVKNNIMIKPTISGDDIVKYYKNATQYYAKFLDKNGNPLKNSAVTFNINGVFYTRNTNDQGVARMNINLNPGTYIITAKHPVNGEMHSNKVTVLGVLSGKDLTKYYRNASQYSMQVLGGDGKPIGAGVKVKYNINGVFYERVTDASGMARMNINLNPGTYTITGEYNGLMHSNTIKVLPVLYAKDITMKYKDGTKFKVKVVDGQGKAFANQTVQFNVNGVFYDRVTDSDGYASLAINLMSGKYIITSAFETARLSNTITINS